METPLDTRQNQPFDGEDLQRMYQNRFKGMGEYRDKVWSVLVRHYFQQWVRREDVVLDLGAGHGEFINNIHCATKYAMDLNPDTAHLAKAGVRVLQQDCSMPWPLEDNSLDVVFTSNFFEHLPDKQTLANTLSEVGRCLKPNGKLICMGPNIKYLPGVYWDFIDHHLPLTENSLSEAMTQKGFQIAMCIDKFLPFTMVNGPQYPLIFIMLYVRLPFAWRILGKQFLVIGKKGSV